MGRSTRAMASNLFFTAARHSWSIRKQCQLAWALQYYPYIHKQLQNVTFWLLPWPSSPCHIIQPAETRISRTWTLGCAQWALYHMWAFLLSIGFGSNKYDRHWHGWNEAKCLLISLCKQRMQMTQSYKYIQIWSNLLSHDFTDLRIPSSNLDMYRYEYVAITGARTSPWPSSLPSPS